MAKLVMVIDTKKCTGCQTCAVACKMENHLPDGVWWNQVFSGNTESFTGDRSKFTKGKLPLNFNLVTDVAQGQLVNTDGIVNDPSKKNVTMDFYTKACQHCSKPTCKDACPYNAIYINEFGVVDTDFSLCIGCEMCIQACPYDVRHLNGEEKWQNAAPGSEGEWVNLKPSEWKNEVGGQGINKHGKNTVDKCTFCSHRLKNNLLPVCVESCIAGARIFGNINDHASEVSHLLRTRAYKQLLPDSGTEPSVYFLY